MVEEKDIQYAKDEDLERAKALWKENGRSIVAGVVIGLSAIAGYNFWQVEGDLLLLYPGRL